MCKYLQELPRYQLASFENKDICFQGYFVRFGTKSENIDDKENVTILIKNPFTYEDGKYIRLGHHLWVDYSPEIEKLKIDHGDRLQAKGRVVCYTKKNGETNYSIVGVHDYSLVSKNSDPGKYNCFDFIDTIKTSAKAFMKVKMDQKFVRAGRFRKRDGTLVKEGQVEFKMRDVLKNGMCRYYYRSVGEQHFQRYAYFSVKNGQVMTIVNNGKRRRFILSEENFYAIKDFVQSVRYSGRYKLPLSPKAVNKERKLEKNKAPGKWESIRKCEPGQEKLIINAYGQRVITEN